MVHHADDHHHPGFDAVMRANRTALLILLWTLLAVCVAGSVVYDIAQWAGVWRMAI
jgi:hypothetical protein